MPDKPGLARSANLHGLALSLVWRKEMGDTIGQVLSSAVGVALSPFPIVAVVLMLDTARGRVNGPAFVLGWVIGLAIVGAVLLSVTNGVDPNGPGERTLWVSVIVLILGVLLLLIALKQWRGRPRQGEAVKRPKWMAALDKFSPVKATGAGVVLSALNPKNLLLAVGGAAGIGQAGLSKDQKVLADGKYDLLTPQGMWAPFLVLL